MDAIANMFAIADKYGWDVQTDYDGNYVIYPDLQDPDVIVEYDDEEV